MKITFKAARVNAGMTQKEAAKLMHISNVTLVNWENGKSKPSYAAVKMMSHIYNCPEELFIFPSESTESSVNLA